IQLQIATVKNLHQKTQKPLHCESTESRSHHHLHLEPKPSRKVKHKTNQNPFEPSRLSTRDLKRESLMAAMVEDDREKLNVKVDGIGSTSSQSRGLLLLLSHGPVIWSCREVLMVGERRESTATTIAAFFFAGSVFLQVIFGLHWVFEFNPKSHNWLGFLFIFVFGKS
ncbi:hypothetical protein V8G54_022654, partial [Vigna mungo]